MNIEKMKRLHSLEDCFGKTIRFAEVDEDFVISFTDDSYAVGRIDADQDGCDIVFGSHRWVEPSAFLESFVFGMDRQSAVKHGFCTDDEYQAIVAKRKAFAKEMRKADYERLKAEFESGG